LAGVNFFLKKERVFFFQGSARKDIRAVWLGEMRTACKQKVAGGWGEGHFLLAHRLFVFALAGIF